MYVGLWICCLIVWLVFIFGSQGFFFYSIIISKNCKGFSYYSVEIKRQPFQLKCSEWSFGNTEIWVLCLVHSMYYIGTRQFEHRKIHTNLAAKNWTNSQLSWHLQEFNNIACWAFHITTWVFFFFFGWIWTMQELRAFRVFTIGKQWFFLG